jgi:hypothetical protein
MIYLKSFLFGIVAAIAASVLWILVAFVFPIVIPLALSRVTGGGGAEAASIGSGSILAAGLVGFAAGFYWQFRRSSRTVRQF